jgi:hypothetical protein
MLTLHLSNDWKRQRLTYPNKKLVMHSNESRKVVTHYFNRFCVTLTTFNSSVIPVLGKLLSKTGGEKEQLPLWIALFYVVLILVWSFVIIGIINIHFQGQTMAQTTNNVLPDTTATANRKPVEGKKRNKNMKDKLSFYYLCIFLAESSCQIDSCHSDTTRNQLNTEQKTEQFFDFECYLACSQWTEQSRTASSLFSE